MADHDRILEIKEAAEGWLRALPGVHAVGIGRKLVRHRPTPELCIAVFLRHKRPPHELAPGEAVPPEIDGVKTDVVEMGVPRLVAAEPGNLNLAIEDAGRTVALRGDNDPPGNGLGIVVLFTPDDPSKAPGYVYVETFKDITKAQIALRIAEELTFHGFPSTALPLHVNEKIARVSLNDGTACKLSLQPNPVLAVDDHDYTKDFLRGGTQIKVKSPKNGDPQAGTLGCIATVAATADSPSMVVGITCHHVLAAPDHRPSNLRFSFKEARLTLAVNDESPLAPQTIVIVRLVTTSQAAIYGSRAGDTPTEVAAGVAAAINHLGVDGVSATGAAGAPIHSLPAAVVDVTGDTVRSCRIYAPPTDADAKLKAVVEGLTLELSGEVPGDDCGIFVHVNSGGVRPTFGVFTRPPQGQAPAAAAADIVAAINRLPEDLRHAERPGTTPARVITASSSGAKVTMSDGQEVECIVKRDIRVGHPNEHFCSRCSPCCDDRIGRVLATRVDVDAALVQLDEGLKYKLAIQGASGLVPGIYDPVQADVDQALKVSKRGRTTGQTSGTLEHLNVSGEAGGRLYANAAIVDAAAGLDFFCLPGDSGAAVVRDDDGRVVGIVFGQDGRKGFMTPIGQILKAFQPLALTLALAPGAATGVDIVPKPAKAAAAAGTAAAAGMTAAAQRSFIEERLEQAEREITATAAGREVAATVMRHLAETRRLVDSRRRVAAAWRRHGGPRILDAALAMLQRRDRRLPAAVDGRPLAECLAGIERALARYASPALAADLARFTPRLAGFAGLTYEQVLATLRTEGAG